MGGDSSRALNAVTIAITAALGGQTDLQAATNALAPYAAQVIGKEFGHGKDKNTAAQMVAHALLGATLAYINGGDPTAGGSAAVASEAAANYFTNQYKDDPRYKDANGEFQPNLLPEDVKAQIRDLTAGIGAVIGGAVGDSSYNAQLAGVIGQNAVENNIDSPKDYQNAKAYSEQLYKDACAAYGLSGAACTAKIRKNGSDGLGTVSNILTFFGLYPTPASPVFLGSGTLLGIGGTALNDSKSKEQRVSEVALSIIAGGAAGKFIGSVNKADGERLYSEATEIVISEASGKIAEKIPESINSCNKDPKQIGCGGVNFK